MKLEYAIFPETHKPVRGMYTVWNPEATAAGEKTLSLDCGRGGSAAGLIALTPRDSDIIVNLSDSAPAFTHHRGADGRALPVVRIEAGWYGLDVNVTRISMNHVLFHPCDDNLERGDALDSDPVQIIRCGETGWVWVEAEIGSGARESLNCIEFRLLSSDMFESETEVGAVKLLFTIYDRAIPRNIDLPFHLDIWQHPTNIARAHRTRPWSDSHFNVLEKYVASLAELGQKCVTLIVSDCPWSGQWCHFEHRRAADLYEYSIVRVTRSPDGVYSYDFSAMQRYIDLCARYGIDREITVFGLVNVWCDTTGGFGKLAQDHPDGAKLRYFDEADRLFKYMRDPADIDAYVSALEQYFVRTGQIDRVRLIADEPGDVAAYRRSIDRVKEVAPRFVLKAALNHAEFVPEFGDRVDDFVPSLECLTGEYDKIEEYKATMPGKRFLWYVCNMPSHPNTFLASDLCETYAVGAVTALFGLDGFLRWSYTVWCDSPVKDNRYFNWPAGDLNFVYPACDGGVMLSLRWKALKKAIALSGLCAGYRAKHGQQALADLLSRVILTPDPRAWFEPGFMPNGTPRPTPIRKDKLFSLDYADWQAVEKVLLSDNPD